MDSYEEELNLELMKLNQKAVEAAKRLSEYEKTHKEIMEKIDNERFAVRRKLDDYRRGL